MNDIPLSNRYRLKRAIKKLPGLVGYWPLNEVEGSTARNYAPANLGSLDGVITGATLGQAGKMGRAYSLDGTNDEITISDNDLLEGMANVTIMFMLNVDDTSVYRKIFKKGSVFDIGINNNGEIFGEINGVGNPGTWGSSPVIDDNVWRMFFMVYNGSAIKLYFNATEVEELTGLSGNVATSGDDVILGQSGTEWYKGLMQHVALFDQALSATEILKLAKIAGLA